MIFNEEKFQKMYDTVLEINTEVKFINKRGCTAGMEKIEELKKGTEDKIKEVSHNLEKNTREHVWLKGGGYVTIGILSVIITILGLIMKGYFSK